MSDALRELNQGIRGTPAESDVDMRSAMRIIDDGDGQFDQAPGEEQEVVGQEPKLIEGDEPGQEPEGAEPEPEPEPKPQQKKPVQKGKQRDSEPTESQKRRLDSAFGKIAERDRQIEQFRVQLTEQTKVIQQLQADAKLKNNPWLAQAKERLEAGDTPEYAEAEAQRLEAEGDKEGANIARRLAHHMRSLQGEAQQESLRQEEAKAQTAWRQLPFGTPEFDRAVTFLKPGPVDASGNGPGKEFNDAWSYAEDNLIKRKEQSPDAWDRECAKQFRDHNSEFGKRLIFFLNQTDYGRAFAGYALGMLPSFDIVKMTMIIDHSQAKLKKLEAENARLRGFTSPAASAPMGGSNYRTNGSLPNRAEDPAAFEQEFSRLPLEQQKAYIRSREAA